jgi:hypothetical protein
MAKSVNKMWILKYTKKQFEDTKGLIRSANRRNQFIAYNENERRNTQNITLFSNSVLLFIDYILKSNEPFPDDKIIDTNNFKSNTCSYLVCHTENKIKHVLWIIFLLSFVF